MELIQPEFAPSTWNSFRLLVLEEQPASLVAETQGLSVNAVLIAKSRVSQAVAARRTGFDRLSGRRCTLNFRDICLAVKGSTGLVHSL